MPWFSQFAVAGRHRLMIAEEDGIVLGYAGTTRFRPKPAYDTTVETTIYCAADQTRKGLGSLSMPRCSRPSKTRTSIAS
jgi:phosphinothricin acetyltransferase